MAMYEDAGKAGKEQMDNTLKSLSVVTKGFQQIAAETGDFTKRSMEQTTAMFEKLSQVRTLDKVVEIQNDYAKTAYESWMAQASKIGEIYAEIARETYKPFDSAAQTAGRFGENVARDAA